MADESQNGVSLINNYNTDNTKKTKQLCVGQITMSHNLPLMGSSVETVNLVILKGTVYPQMKIL